MTRQGTVKASRRRRVPAELARFSPSQAQRALFRLRCIKRWWAAEKREPRERRATLAARIAAEIKAEAPETCVSEASLYHWAVVYAEGGLRGLVHPLRARLRRFRHSFVLAGDGLTKGAGPQLEALAALGLAYMTRTVGGGRRWWLWRALHPVLVEWLDAQGKGSSRAAQGA